MIFTTVIDAGSPSFSFKEEENVHIIINGSNNDKGRWLSPFHERLIYGDQYKISGTVYTTAALLRVSLVWIANLSGQHIHSVVHAIETTRTDTPKPFEYIFTVPTGVKSMNVELRGRSGSGLFEFKDIEIEEYDAGEPPPPPDEEEEEPNFIVTSVIVGKTRWRITTTEDSVTFLKLKHEPLLNENGKIFYID